MELQKPVSASVKKAVDYLRSNLTNGVWKEGERLPSYRALARTAGLGQKNMNAAITVLKEENLLSVKRRAGIFVGSRVPCIDLPSKINISKSEIIRDRIKQDLLKGSFQESEFLPSFKELTRSYGVGYRTIKKSLESLEKEQLVSAIGQRYRITMYQVQKAKNTLYLFSSKNIELFKFWSFERDWVNVFIRTLEKECYERNIQLVRLWFVPGKKQQLHIRNSLGSIVVLDAEDQHNEKIFTMLHSLTVQMLPLVVINFANGFHVPFISKMEQFAQRNSVFMSDFYSNRQAGFDLGRFLIAQGHKKICFFCHERKPPVWWNRYEGLVEAFGSMGGADAIVSFFFTDYSTPFGALGTSKKDATIQTTLTKEHAFIEGHLNSIIKADLPMHKVQERLSSHLYEILNGIQLHSKYLPLFRKALDYKDVTAWVCVEDYLANFAALEFLKSENVKVPEQIGLAGFQDHIESSINGVTSYRLDMSQLAFKSISLVLYPEYARKTLCHKGTTIFDIDGMVIDRGSV